MTMRRMLFATLLALVAGVGPLDAAFAQQTGHAEGEVRRIDADAGKVTIRHGPISGGLDMPAMTMVFRVRDPAMLKTLAPGEKVRFTVIDDRGALVLQSVEKAK